MLLYLLLDPPDISLSTTPSYTNEDMNISVRCLASGNPNDYNFLSWTHTIGGVTWNVTGESTNQNTNSLQLQNIDYTHDGMYRCFVTNGITGQNGEHIMSKHIQINVKSRYTYHSA